MKLFLSLLILISLVLLAIYLWLSTHQFGQAPSPEDRVRLAASKNYDATQGVFRNSSPDRMYKEMNIGATLKEYVFGPQIRFPTEALPTMTPDLEAFLKDDGTPLKWIWLGHSTIYLNLRGLRILIDPVYGSASPLSFMVTRFQKPVLSLNDIPKPDLVILSHDHYDHTDADMMRFLADKADRFLVPLGLGSRLRHWGVAAEKITEHDWYDESVYQDISFRAAPAQHFSGRGLNDRNRTFWASWIIRGAGLNLYYSGDSGYSPHFKEIGKLYGPFDFAFLECGQYNSNWHYVHMFPEESAQAALDIGATQFMPVHWGLYNLSIHDWFEPIERVSRAAEQLGLRLWHPKQGELVRFPGEALGQVWWRTHPDFLKRTQELP